MTLGTCHSSTDERDKRPGKAHPPYQPRNTHKDTHAYATTQTVYKHPITHVSQTEILLLIIIHNLCYFFIDSDPKRILICKFTQKPAHYSSCFPYY